MTNTSPFLQIVVNPNGSVTRPVPFPASPPTGTDTDSDSPVLSTDVTVNSTIWARVYRPKQDAGEKLPIILFFHGGGFILFSPATAPYHNFCEKLAVEIPAVVVSVDYRLSPEFRLPAAYDDARDAIRWVRTQAECPQPELRRGDFSRCFLMGSSSGGNIVYYSGLQEFKDLKSNQHDLFNIVGIMMHQPYFGGVKRKLSESTSEDDPILPLRANDLMWELSLPQGSDRDHHYSNPVINPPKAEELRSLPRCLVTGNTGDPLVDRQLEFVEMLSENEVHVVQHFIDGQIHAYELFDPVFASKLIDRVRDFMAGS